MIEDSKVLKLEIKLLSNKIDKLLQLQLRLIKSVNLKSSPNKINIISDKKFEGTKANQLSDNEIDKWLMGRDIIKKKFNLKTTPKINAVLQYLATGNDEIFDNYKRND
jgi:hypothetical protein